MSFTAPLFVPLASGLDLSKEATLGEGELHVAENVDFSVDGQVKGRPSRSAPLLFAPIDPALNTQYLSDRAFTNLTYKPTGLVRLRDANGERPALATEGRLFSQDGTRWVDRGPFACTRVDEVIKYRSHLDGTTRGLVAPDFGMVQAASSTDAYFDLLTPAGHISRRVKLTIPAAMAVQAGNGARCGTTTAAVFVTTDNTLNFVYRVSGGDTLTRVSLAVDALATITDIGDAPSISCSYDSANFFIAYKSTAANVVRVIKTTTTGAVVATYVSAAIPGLAGIWVDNSSVAKDKVALGFGHTGGFTTRVLSHALVDQAKDSTTISFGAVGGDCVVGVDDDVTSLRAPFIWWAYRSGTAVGDGDIIAGYASMLLAATITTTQTLYGGGAFQEAAIRWGIAHQPLRVNGRMYLTLCAAANRNKTGTWITLDLTDNTAVWNAVTTPCAVGPALATVPFFAPSSAVALTDGTGWTFQTLNWAQFVLDASSVTTGYEAAVGLTKVTLSKPQAVQVGDMTVFSGSVPYMVAGNQATELGFPFCGGIPGISVNINTSSAGFPISKSYSVCAVWRWVDASGAIHRSAPSVTRNVTTPGAANVLEVVVTNPLLSAKDFFDLRIEVYTTGYDAALAPTTILKLQKTSACSLSDAYTVITLNTQPVTNTDSLYTTGSGSGVFANYHVPGDGGVAAVGRRLWMAGAHSVYASKLLEPGVAPGFNDEGALKVNLPSGAGRVVCLSSLDDKLAVLCERGVFIIPDGGPDNAGSGPDFSSPIRVSDLSVAGPRASCSTDLGVLFCSTLDSVDPSRGGPWLIDRQLTITDRQFAGRPALDKFLRTGNWVPEVAYSAERQQAYITVPLATATESGVVVLDMRGGKYSTWNHPAAYGTIKHIACVSGLLWSHGTEPAVYNGAPGSDASGAYVMRVVTSHLAANGQKALGWGRVRAITPLSAEGSGAHTLTINAVQDTMRSSTSGALTVLAPAAGTTWPAQWQNPEWRLPTPKCSTIQVELSATPATAKWSAIRLDVTPLPPTAPARNRT